MAKLLETKAIQKVLVEIQEIQKLVSVSGRVQFSPPVLHQTRKDYDVKRLIELLRGDWLVSVVGYFINHRPASSYAKLDDEYKVQDLIYCLGLTQIPDLQYEDPQKKNIGALTSTRVDFSSIAAKLFLEIKLANSGHIAKKIEAEISEDIVKYGKQKTFQTLIFFIYCYDYSFPNPREFERGFTGTHTIEGHQFEAFCIIKP